MTRPACIRRDGDAAAARILALFVLLLVACGGNFDDGAGAGAGAGADGGRLSDGGNYTPFAVLRLPGPRGIGEYVEADGSGSYDPEGLPLTYAWQLQPPAGSTAQLSDSTSPQVTFFVDVPGRYVLTLVVSDGQHDSDPAIEELTGGNGRPRAVMSVPGHAYVRAVVALNGAASTDPDGDPLTYSWVLEPPTGSNAALTDDTLAMPSFRPDLPGTYGVRLVVRDAVLPSSAANAFIWVENRPPIVSAGDDVETRLDNSVTLLATASDPDGVALNIAWEITSAPATSTATLAGSTTLTPTLVPDVYGAYTLKVTVTDGIDTASDEVVVAAPHDMELLSYRVADAEYSRVLDRIVMLSSWPPALHIYDPVTSTDVVVDLPRDGNAVSISPSGVSAAVAHDGLVSIIDLQAGTIDQSYLVSMNLGDVVLADNGYVYVFSGSGVGDQMSSVELATGLETIGSGYEIRARLHPTQGTLYGTELGLDTRVIHKFDLGAGVAAHLWDTRLRITVYTCGNLWFTEDGLRLLTRCGDVASAAAAENADMVEQTTWTGIDIVQHMDHSGSAGLVAMIEENAWARTGKDVEVKFFDDQAMTLASSASIPPLYLGGSFHPGHGRYVFWRSDASEVYVIAQADDDSGALHGFAVVRMAAP